MRHLIQLKKSVNTVVIICFYFCSAVGSVEVLFVEDQVNSENITSIAIIHNKFGRKTIEIVRNNGSIKS